MLKSRNIQIIGITVLLIAVTLVTISAVRPSGAASVDLSWPPRPDFSFLSQNVNSDFHQRHPEMAMSDQNALIPVAGGQAATDYYQRHSDLNVEKGIVADMSDYSLRHPELFQMIQAGTDSSDYFLRH